MTDWLQAHGLSPELQTKLLLTAITIVALWAVHRIVLGLAYRRATDPWTRYRWRKGVTYVTLGVGIVLVSRTPLRTSLPGPTSCGAAPSRSASASRSVRTQAT